LRIIKQNKRILIPVLIYLILLPFIFHLFSGSPPETEVSIYKGVFGHSFPMGFDRLHEDGVNILAFGPVYLVGPRGNLLPLIHEVLAVAALQAAHRNGFKVFWVMELAYGLPPRPIPEKILENTDLLDSYNKKVIKGARIAEKYGVELFSPLNEPEVKLGAEASFKWGQEILPKIKEVYHGKVVWKGDIMRNVLEAMEQGAKTNFTGYDYLGTSMTPYVELRKYAEEVERVLEGTAALAKRDGVPEIMITEFGTWYVKDVKTPEDHALAHEIVLGKGRDKVKGYFVLDDGRLKGSLTEEVIQKWYTTILP